MCDFEPETLSDAAQKLVKLIPEIKSVMDRIEVDVLDPLKKGTLPAADFIKTDDKLSFLELLL
jgi:hypothetical protein